MASNRTGHTFGLVLHICLLPDPTFPVIVLVPKVWKYWRECRLIEAAEAKEIEVSADNSRLHSQLSAADDKHDELTQAASNAYALQKVTSSGTCHCLLAPSRRLVCT